MSIVIGPYTQDEWNMMLSIISVRPEHAKDPMRYADVSKMEENILAEYKRKRLT